MKSRIKHIVLLESDINKNSMNVPLHGISTADCKIEYQNYLNADDVVFLTDANILYSLKCRHTEYSISSEERNFKWYCDSKNMPKLITFERANFLGELLRLHRDNTIDLSAHEFHMIVITLFRRWYPNLNISIRQLNKLRTKYKSYLNDNKSKRSNWDTYI